MGTRLNSYRTLLRLVMPMYLREFLLGQQLDDVNAGEQRMVMSLVKNRVHGTGVCGRLGLPTFEAVLCYWH